MKKILMKFLITAIAFLLVACNKNEVAPNLTAGKGGSLARFAIVDDYMYFVDNQKMQVYDITSPKEPKILTTVNIFSTTVETIFSHGDYLYLGSSDGMYIYGIKNRKSPQYMSMATHVSGCDPVVSDGKYAYVTVRNTTICNRTQNANILEIYDVQNPSSPVWVSTTSMTAPIGLAIDGDVLFVCDAGLKLYDVSDRSKPVLIKTIPSNAIDIIIDGDNILTVDDDGINQYSYNRANLEITYRSKIITRP